ncbi:MAG: Asp-tRNA(Asn)/Glu-tRNA(Gln) amidotransferase subunit GatB [Deltaproteobacteria bacterium]|nr:Asp-tRNA(Asn)/Glu-tRNA(Gln) amidotransferase subunit GatB [Deltaproteobacteria bacterium]
MSYEPVIGLEVHAQLLTRTKLFCRCSTRFGAEPNANTCPVCFGLPGVLPVLNGRVVEFTIRAGLATHCEITRKNIFARKNYFYPDLPKGYQISQYENPICAKGWLDIEVNGERRRIGLTRIHMEEDAGKLLHEHPATRSKAASWVDLNRAGVPLMEIVSEPDLRVPEEAVAYLKELRRLLVALDVCDGNMEEGSLRCDANISIRPVGSQKFGTKVEIKNMNSFRHVEKALHYEIKRQTEVLETGGVILQETRLWDPDREVSESMRSKEAAHDYRYFPDPDLLPVEIDDAWIEKIRKNLPELPQRKRERFVSQFQLTMAQAEVLTETSEIASYFEGMLKKYSDSKKLANWIINSPFPIAKLRPDHFAKILTLVDQGTLSSNMAKEVLQKVYETESSPEEVIQKEGLAQVSDTGALEAALNEVISENPKEVERLRQGEEKLFSFFLGQVMKKTKGKANPKLLNDLLRKKIGR